MTKRVKYTAIWKESIEIVKENKFSFFTTFRFSIFHSLLHNFNIFPPPPPHFIIYIFSIHDHINLTCTLHRPYIDLTSTLHRPSIDPTSIPHRPYTQLFFQHRLVNSETIYHHHHISIVSLHRHHHRRHRISIASLNYIFSLFTQRIEA